LCWGEKRGGRKKENSGNVIIIWSLLSGGKKIREKNLERGIYALKPPG